MKIFHCEIKRNRPITPQLCAICPRIERCRAFRQYYRQNSTEYIDFVTKIVEKFPDKYIMEVLFMAEKQSFVQIVDRVTGNVERVADLKEIEALSVEDKLALARSKTLYVVSHKLEPVIKVEMRKVSISAPVSYQEHPAEQPVPVKVEKVEKPVEKAKPVKPFKEEKVEKQAEIAIKPVAKGRPKKNS